MHATRIAAGVVDSGRLEREFEVIVAGAKKLAAQIERPQSGNGMVRLPPPAE
jgi:hypothetical protein